MCGYKKNVIKSTSISLVPIYPPCSVCSVVVLKVKEVFRFDFNRNKCIRLDLLLVFTLVNVSGHSTRVLNVEKSRPFKAKIVVLNENAKHFCDRNISSLWNL